MERDYILEAADAIAVRDPGLWKSFYLLIRLNEIVCVGVGLITKTDYIINRFTTQQLEEGLTDNQWSAVSFNLKTFFEREFKCQTHPIP